MAFVYSKNELLINLKLKLKLIFFNFEIKHLGDLLNVIFHVLQIYLMVVAVILMLQHTHQMVCSHLIDLPC